jgi:phage/plasmid-like protein (TIGR03299 family)
MILGGIEMSAETMQWLNTYTLRGFTETRGTAWHYMLSAQGEESYHYPGAIPVEDVIRRLMSWEALAVPMHYTVPEIITTDGVTEARTFEAPGRKVIVRSDTGEVLGVFRDSYEIHQFSEWLVDGIAGLIDTSKGDLAIGSAGLLKGGAVGWVQVDMPENITTPEGVEFRPHLFATTSHDGSLATTYGKSVTAIVCDNTLSAALGESGEKFSVRHSKNSGLRINDARDALNMIHTVESDFAEEVAKLTKIKVTGPKFSKFLDLWAPIPTDETAKNGRVDPRAVTLAERKRETFTGLYTSDPRVTPWKGTGFGVLQADNTFGQHMTAVRDGSEDETKKGAKRYARSIMQAADGTLDRATREARTMLMQAVG